jgi:class 3 adenylate cyclase
LQQFADWLKKLGMSEYAERFAENRIDLSVLPDLTDQHLEKLGVALGDRLKILRAIREFSATTVAAQPGPSAAPVVQDSAERRQLTVMFAIWWARPALSPRFDLEGAAQELAVVGEALNLAARLQAVAAPGRVVIGPRSWYSNSLARSLRSRLR